jgi:hypothetical protein
VPTQPMMESMDCLKVACNENHGGSGKSYARHKYRIVAIDVLLAFNFAVILVLMVSVSAK